MNTRLVEYLRHRTSGGFAWITSYEKQLAQNPAWMAGHYAGLLDDVLRIIGDRRICDLVVASDAVEQRLRDVTDGVVSDETVDP